MHVINISAHTQKALKGIAHLVDGVVKSEKFVRIADNDDMDDRSLTMDHFVNYIMRRLHPERFKGYRAVFLDGNCVKILRENVKGGYEGVKNLVLAAAQLNFDVLMVNIPDDIVLLLNNDRSVGKIVQWLNADEIYGSGKLLMLRSQIYDQLVLDAMGGNDEALGNNVHNGIMHVVGENVKQLNNFAHQMSNIKDIMPLDVSYENVLRFCHNAVLPGAERMHLSALLLNRPLKESMVRLGEDGLVDKSYWYLADQEWKQLMMALHAVNYPVIFVHEPSMDRFDHIPDDVKKMANIVLYLMECDLLVMVDVNKNVD